MSRGARPPARSGPRRGSTRALLAAGLAATCAAGGLGAVLGRPTTAGWLLAALTPGRASAAPAVVSIGPADDFCRALRALPPGGELILAPGDYPAGCAIKQGGTPGAPLIIRAADPDRRPRLVYPGTEANVLDLRADHVVVRGLAFGPTQRDVDAIRIRAAQDVAIEDCEFAGIRGIPIVANHESLRGVVVRRNRIVDSHSTAIYLGCHDGTECVIRDIAVEGNYVRRTGLGGQGVGFGVQIKLNSVAAVRDNVIVDPRGPGIMVYGAGDPRHVSIVEGNFVQGSSRSSGIVIGGGPALVRNNISVGNSVGGIGLEDYGGRGLLRGIAVTHNTVHGNARGGIVVRAGSVADVVVANNAVQSWMGALPGARAGLALAGNVECRGGTACFRDPSGRDFSPGRLLLAAGAVRSDLPVPGLDFFGIRRGAPPSVGAVERDGMGAIADGAKAFPAPPEAGRR